MFAFRPETEKAEASEVKIADVVLDTPLHTSTWGDENLFFKHTHVGRDRMYWSGDLKRLREDPSFDKNDPANIWGRQVPDYWPSDPEAAENTYID